jgi:hypothetical protein
MNHRCKSSKGSANAVRARALRFDLLEDRRLFAGLDSLRVLVFEDPTSQRFPGDITSPVRERVVFVDVNRDGAFQQTEPWSITDNQGFATFQGLAPGNYSVRLLSHRSVLETTSTRPAGSGDWKLGFGVTRAVDWDSDSVGWFAGDHSLKKLDVSGSILLDEIELGGKVVQVETLDPSYWIAIVEKPEGSRLVSVDRSTQVVRAIPMDDVRSFSVVGDDLLAIASNSKGTAVFRIPTVSGEWEFLIPSKLAPVIQGTSSEPIDIHAIGSRELVLVESLAGDSRVSSWQQQSGIWQLVAERSFDGAVHFSSRLSDSRQFALETANGLLVVSNTSGLPTVELLEQSTGNAVFDSSRGILLAQSKNALGTVQGWSVLDWNQLFEIKVSDPTNGPVAGPIDLSLGYLRDSLVAAIDGNIYQHSLSASTGVSVSISERVLKEIAIGIRTRGENRSPTLRELPDFSSDEDIPFAIPIELLNSRGNDSDGDTLHYFIRGQGAKGRMQASSTDFALFVPSKDANGADLWSVQAFDGLAWSDLQSFRIDIRPLNDPPSAISGASEFLGVPESILGVTFGRFEVMDPDADASYRFAVSDSRFVIANGMLSLRPNTSLDYEAAKVVVLTVSATEINTGDSISKQVTLHVEDRNDPPQELTFDGSGSLTENTGLAFVGYVGVIDQDSLDVYDIRVSDSRFEVVGNAIRVKTGSGIPYQDSGWVEFSIIAVARNSGDTIRRTERLRLVQDITPYHNDGNPMDVDGDGVVSPLDPLVIINHLNRNGSGPIQAGEGEGVGQIDVDGDGEITPLDILIIINELNARSGNGNGPSSTPRAGTGTRPSGEGEGPSSASRPLSVPVAAPPVSEDDLPGRRSRRLVR